MKFAYKKVTYRLRWLQWLLALSIPLLLLFLVFGKGGLIHNYVLQMKLESLQEALVELERDNTRMYRDIQHVEKGNAHAQLALAKQALIAPQGSYIYIFPTEEQQSISETLDSIEKESTEGVYFANFLGAWWSD